MAAPRHTRSLVCAAKRLKTIPSTPLTSHLPIRQLQTQRPLPEPIATELSQLRLPRAVQATYLAPLKRQPSEQRTPTCDLQLRSYSVRNLEIFADFALRAAYFLHLPASGPVPLPRITERWTVPRSNFIFKKSQENFERITLRRLIQIQDGHPDVVGVWLDFLQKYRYFGVGMKANVWDYSGLDVAEQMDGEAQNLLSPSGEFMEKLELLGAKEKVAKNEAQLEKRLFTEPFKAQWGAYAPMGGNSSVPAASDRIDKEKVGGEERRSKAGRTRKNAGQKPKDEQP